MSKNLGPKGKLGMLEIASNALRKPYVIARKINIFVYRGIMIEDWGSRVYNKNAEQFKYKMAIRKLMAYVQEEGRFHWTDSTRIPINFVEKKRRVSQLNIIG